MDRVEAVRTAMADEEGPKGLDFRLGGEGHGVLGTALLRKRFFPDLTVRVVEAYEAEGDRVVAVLEVGARGRTWDAIAIFRFDGDEVVEYRTVADHVEWMQLIGVVPDGPELARALDAAAEAAQPGT